jgi:hypothetical protein
MPVPEVDLVYSITSSASASSLSGIVTPQRVEAALQAPWRRCDTEKRDELAAVAHSITSSAPPRN